MPRLSPLQWSIVHLPFAALQQGVIDFVSHWSILKPDQGLFYPQRMAMTKKSLLYDHAGMRLQRVDARSRHIVECGIAMQSRYNTVCALEYLKSHNVGAAVIERVLSHQALHRPVFCAIGA
jgi:hypothetical protein